MHPTAKHILCVEPAPDVREVIQALLRARGYETDAASTIAEALDKARGAAYSLYVINDGYTDGTNAELMARLRALWPTTPVIVFSAQAFARDRERALADGAAVFLPKPDGLFDLPQTVERLLSPAVYST